MHRNHISPEVTSQQEIQVTITVCLERMAQVKQSTERSRSRRLQWILVYNLELLEQEATLIIDKGACHRSRTIAETTRSIFQELEANQVVDRIFRIILVTKIHR